MKHDDWSPSEPCAPFEGKRKGLSAVACAADGEIFVQGGGKVAWVRDGRVVRSMTGYGGVACADRDHLLIGGSATALRLVRIADGGDARWFRDGSHVIEDLAVSRDGSIAVSAAYDGARVWNVAAPGFSPPVRTIAAHARGVQRLALDPSAKWLATRSFEELRIWDLATGAKVADLTGVGGRLVRPTFSPDGTLLATSSEDHARATLVRVGHWTVERTFACGDEPTALAFSPDGRLLACACGAYDAVKILIFDLAEEAPQAVIAGPITKVGALAFSRDGGWLYAASDRLHGWRRVGAGAVGPSPSRSPTAIVDVPRTRPNARPLEVPATVDAVEPWVMSLPWLTSLGVPSPWDSGAVRVASFEAWPGPEDEGVEELDQQDTSWLEEIEAAAKTYRLDHVRALYDRVRSAVTAIAGAHVAYDPGKDPWDARWASAHHAAHTAGLVAAFVALGWKLPEDLEERLAWFARGHWPMAYVDDEELDDKDAIGTKLLVY